MHYYDFYRHYSVPGRRFDEARIKFSRALEDGEEDQYYVDTTYGFSRTKKQVSFKNKFLHLVPWFLEEAINQLLGYPNQNKGYKSE
jgi:hypothetical protein